MVTCLLRNAESFAVQGLMMVSEGEMYCLTLYIQEDVSKKMKRNKLKRKRRVSDIPILSHSGLEHLAMVLHALHVLAERLPIG